ncbi:MAG: DUF1456 family protein [Fusobacteria bacterium]|nr:DUF1456 family protein [Fusobacteriota bacterium]
MTNNDVLRKIRYALNLSDDKMIKIFALSGKEADREEVSNYLKKDENPDFSTIGNPMFLSFLNGLIISKRGPSDKERDMKEKVSNNLIMKKLKIALSFSSEEMHEVFELSGIDVSKPELTSIFRAENHKNYKECGDRYLRNFLKGLAIKYRDEERTLEN